MMSGSESLNPSAAQNRRVGLRPPAQGDVTRLLEIEHMLFATDRIPRRSFRRFIQSRPASMMICAEVDQVLVGYVLVLTPQRSQIARLYSLAVDPSHQGLGLGKRLLEAIEPILKQRGFRQFRLEVRPDNATAQRLYERLGFQRQDRLAGFYEDGADALRYGKLL